MQKILFILPDKKLLYDNGKIKEVKGVYDLSNTEIRFAKQIMRDDNNKKDRSNLPAFVWENRNVKLNGLSLRQLYYSLAFHEFILFIDHEKKEIELLIDDGRIIKFSYSDLVLVKEFFTKVGGMLLESDSFKNLELYSYDGSEAVKEAVKKMEKRSVIKRIFNALKLSRARQRQLSTGKS